MEKVKLLGDYEIVLKEYCKGSRNSQIYIAQKGSHNENQSMIKNKFLVRVINLEIAYKNISTFERIYNNKNILNESGVTVKIEEFIKPKKRNLYIFYNFVDYKTLQQLIDEGISKIPYDRKLLIAYNFAQSLYILHSKKLIHRNLTPEHILINKRSTEVIFCGLSSIFKSEDKVPPDSIEKNNYSAPELINYYYLNGQENQYNEKVDVYSFGAIVLKLFTG